MCSPCCCYVVSLLSTQALASLSGFTVELLCTQPCVWLPLLLLLLQCFPCGNKGCCKNLKQVNEKRITKAKSPSPRPASDGYASPSAAAPAAAAGTPERAAAANDMVR
jgi:hypothetical protein